MRMMTVILKKFLYTRWIHEKTGHVYYITGECRLKQTNEPAFLYVREDDRDGISWARSIDEFMDGRFTLLQESAKKEVVKKIDFD